MSFDAEYFERFYERRGTRVYDAEQVANLARGVTSMIRWLGGELRSVLDVGAGAGKLCCVGAVVHASTDAVTKSGDSLGVR